MALVTPNIAIAVFIIIVIISAIIAWQTRSYKDYEPTSFHTFIGILAGLGVFVTFMFYYNVVEIQQQQQNIISTQDIMRLNEQVVNDLYDEMLKASEYIPRFVISLNPLVFKNKKNDLPAEQTSIEGQLMRHILSHKIFLVWENTMLSREVLEHDTLSFLTGFLQMAHSRPLYQQWEILQFNFPRHTQDFINLLFKYAYEVNIQDKIYYQRQAREMMRDPEFLKLMAN